MLSLGKMGLINSNKYPALFEKFLSCTTFEELSIPLYVAATNLLSGKITYFSKGDLIAPMVASSALPPYFSPIKIGEGVYCDGGLLNNFPIEPLKGKCDVLIGSFINPLESVEEKDLSNPIKFFQRIYNVIMDGSYEKKFKKCDFVFLQELSNIGVLDTKQIDAAFEYGYQQALSMMTTLKNCIVN